MKTKLVYTAHVIAATFIFCIAVTHQLSSGALTWGSIALLINVACAIKLYMDL